MNTDKSSIVNKSQPSCLGSILRWGFKIINWNHFKMKSDNGKPYYKSIIKIKGFRTAVVDRYDGNRSTNRFYWRVGKYYL